MESFWTDTPFGITILASMALTMIASLYIAVRNIVRVRAGDAPTDDNAWLSLAAYLFGYALIMLFITYGAILVYYIAGGMLDLIESRYAVSFQQWIWQIRQVVSICAWLGAATLVFRRVFRRWL